MGASVVEVPVTVNGIVIRFQEPRWSAWETNSSLVQGSIDRGSGCSQTSIKLGREASGSGAMHLLPLFDGIARPTARRNHARSRRSYNNSNVIKYMLMSGGTINMEWRQLRTHATINRTTDVVFRQHSVPMLSGGEPPLPILRSCCSEAYGERRRQNEQNGRLLSNSEGRELFTPR